MSMAVGGKKGAAMSDINVTPMADIMIVLLIIFMVITPMLQKGVPVTLPTAGNTKERKEEQKTITVAVTRDSSMYVGATKFENPAEFVKDIRDRLEELPDGSKMIHLKADESLEYSAVMKVMDLVREAGVEEISLISEKKVSS